jgi:hypothetical protein
MLAHPGLARRASFLLTSRLMKDKTRRRIVIDNEDDRQRADRRCTVGGVERVTHRQRPKAPYVLDARLE